MKFRFTAEDEAFRDEVRTWLRANIPSETRPKDGSAMRAFDTAWQRRQHEGGWGGIAWPVDYGGRGLSLIQQLIWHEEYVHAGAPPPGCMFVALSHAGPTVMLRGTEAQKALHIPRIIAGDAVWCQGFSEPGAGSDLASIRMRGVVDGEDLVVTGQKVWTSYGDVADYQELLVRTDPSSERHKGLAWVICDMRLPGITVRPIRTMAGITNFCEVFYDEVRIPLDQVVGGLDEGWSVAMSTLSFERGTAMIPHQVELQRTVEELIALAGNVTGPDGRRPAIADDEVRARLAGLRAEVAAMRAMTYASISRAQRQDAPGPEGAMISLYFGELFQRVHAAAMDILGDASLERAGDVVAWTFRYLDGFKHTIAGGTSEIRRNIIGERVLGLPRGRA
jgi:alkylation response protein AidB-like acyl-CoA dehydrogenase